MTTSEEDPFKCFDCGVDTSQINEYYMVNDHLWAKSGMTQHGGMLCIGCLENRIGRKLEAHDFTVAPINHGFFFDRSQRMLDRLGILFRS